MFGFAAEHKSLPHVEFDAGPMFGCVRPTNGEGIRDVIVEASHIVAFGATSRVGAVKIEVS